MTAGERPASVLDEHLTYLDDLRESGAINMFGARPYLEETFGLERSAARAILAYWMQTFSARHATLVPITDPDEVARLLRVRDESVELERMRALARDVPGFELRS